MPTFRTVERFYPRRIFRRWRRSIGTSTPTAMVSPLGLFRGSIPRGRTSPGARDTTVSVATPEDADLYRDVVDRIARKIEGAAEALPAPEVRITDEATVGLVTVGGCRAAVLEALELLEEEGIALDFLRVTGFPFSTAVEEFLLAHDVNIVVEQNRDAQLKRLLMLETAVPKNKLASVLDYGGAPLSAEVVAQGVRDRLGLVPVAAG